MTEDTEHLRSLVERPEKVRFWGRDYTITPRLIDDVFGDGKRLLDVVPLNTRPNYFVVRVDSTFDPDSDAGYEVLGEIADAAEDQFGRYDSQDVSDVEREFPVVDWSIGYAWGKPYDPKKLEEDK